MNKKKYLKSILNLSLIGILIFSTVFINTAKASDTNDFEISTVAEENLSWGIKAMGLDKYVAKLTEEGNDVEIKVAIIDTGINANHEVFEGRLDLNSSYAKNYITRTTDLTDTSGRGTAIASIIAESTPSNVKIIPAKVINSDAPLEILSRLDQIYDAIQILSKEADVLCFAIGKEASFLSEEDVVAFYEMLDREIYSTIKSPILVNNVGDLSTADTKEGVQFPGFIEGVAAVTGVDTNMVAPETVCVGPEVDMACPGVDIKVASNTNNTGYKTVTGTQYAAAFFCGAYADVLAELRATNPAAGKEDVLEVLRANCVDIGETGKDNIYGYGFLNFKSNMFNKAVEIEVENSSSSKATVTFDSDNSSTEDFTAETEQGLVSVTCDIPCYVLTTTDGGATYTVLEGTVSESDANTYNYEFDLEQGLEMVVSIKGDTDFNGIVNGNDAVEIKNLIRSGEVQNLSPLNELLFNLDGEGVVNGNDVVALKNNIKGTELFTW